jgi:murein DD-endopeptidase MepM/ murein hydrolase activator NlpD
MALPDGSGLALPAGRVSSGFGWRRDPFNGAARFHKGIDVAMVTGDPVPAAGAGVVTFAGQLPGYGLTVTVRHDNGYETRYAHLSAASVSAGDQVAQGTTIGSAGASGRATGPHLHFEVLAAGQQIDPEEALDALGGLGRR